MIYQYKNNGYNIVLDVNSGSVHVVDDVVYDVIPLFEEKRKEEIYDDLKDRYNEEEIKEAIEDVEELKKEEMLFTEDVYKDYVLDFKKRKTVVK